MDYSLPFSFRPGYMQDPLNQMVILCDAKLQELFGCESISGLEMQEVLARHHIFRKT